jgi:predicted ATP-grasp superfamily ATP-dependent carboligase
MMPTAYVINMGANGLAVARTLGRSGVPVIGIDSHPKAPGFASRYVDRLLIEDIREDPKAAVEALIQAGEGQDRKGVIFPASDDAVQLLAHHERELSKHFHFNVPPEGVREAMVDKRLQYREAVRLGIPVPETCFPSGPDDLEMVAYTVRFPAFIKPLRSHKWCATFDNKGFAVKDAEELRNKMKAIFASGHEVMVQTIMTPTGKDLYSVGAYFGRNGYVSPDFCWHKLRQYPPSFGVGSLVKSAHQPEVRELAIRFMKGMGYRGIGYVEFKRDQRDGAFKMVEMNARTGQTNALQAAAGIPLVLFQYCDLIGHPLPEVGDYPDGMVWWDSLNDINSFWRLYRRGEINTFQWLQSIAKVDVHAYYALTDPFPMLWRYRYGGELAKKAYDLLRMKTDEDALDRSRTAVFPAKDKFRAIFKRSDAKKHQREDL